MIILREQQRVKRRYEREKEREIKSNQSIEGRPKSFFRLRRNASAATTCAARNDGMVSSQRHHEHSRR
jgi:hypothetical protein